VGLAEVKKAAKAARASLTEADETTFTNKRERGSLKKRLPGRALHRDQKAVEETLMPVFVNPNKAKSIKVVLDRIGEACRIAGFVDKEEQRRAWAFVISDEGAHLDPTALGEGDDKYRRLHHVVGSGHELLNILKPSLKVLASLGGEVLGEMLEYKTPRQKETLWLGKCNHKSNDFVAKIVLPAFIGAMTALWGDKNAEGGSPPPVGDLFEWAMKCANATLREHAVFYFTVCGGYSLARDAVRGNRRKDFISARRTLTPLLFVSNSNRYGPYLLRDTANVEWCWSEEMKALSEKYFSLHGRQIMSAQGGDFVHEQIIRAAKRSSPCRTAPDLEWAAWYRRFEPNASAVLEANFGIPARQCEDARGEPTYEEDITKVKTFLIQFYSRHEHDKRVMGYRGEEAAVVPSELAAEGKKRLEDYLGPFLQGDPPSFPCGLVPPPPFQSKKRKKE